MNELNRITIYIIDDDEDDQFLLKEAINQIIVGATIISFYDGGHFVDHLSKIHGSIKPDIIFLDINMPLMNGIDTLKYIRDNNYLADVPIIILSTTQNTGHHLEAVRLGAKQCYPKPSSFTDLTTLIGEISKTHIKTQVE